MLRILKQLPYPMAGVMLSMLTLGNYIGDTVPYVKLILTIVAGLIGILLISKLVMIPKSLGAILSIAPISATLMTFPMALMLLAANVKGLNLMFATLLWWIGLIAAVVLILFYVKKHVLSFKIENVYASYFVLFVGIVVASVTAPAFGYLIIGKVIFWYGLIVYAICLPVVVYRYRKFGQIKTPLKPLIVIFAAPANLLVVGYLKAFDDKSFLLLSVLIGLGTVFTIASIVLLPKLYMKDFYPSYSAFTFPLAIAALAMKGYNQVAEQLFEGKEAFSIVLLFTNMMRSLNFYVAVGVIALVFVLYVKHILIDKA